MCYFYPVFSVLFLQHYRLYRQGTVGTSDNTTDCIDKAQWALVITLQTVSIRHSGHKWQHYRLYRQGTVGTSDNTTDCIDKAQWALVTTLQTVSTRHSAGHKWQIDYSFQLKIFIIGASKIFGGTEIKSTRANSIHGKIKQIERTWSSVSSIHPS